VTTDFLDSILLWALFGATVLIVLTATEVGFWAGQKHSKKTREHNEAQVTSMTGAHLGLLAFFIAFSFGLAAKHFDDRKSIILAEANSIETAYLRTKLVAGPQSENIRTLLLEYTALRLQAVEKDKQTAVLQGSSQLHTEIWHEIEQLVSTGQTTPIVSLLVQAINNVFDLHGERIFVGIENRIPTVIWISLYTVLTLSMGGVGFLFGLKGSRSVIPSTALALSFSMMLYLIADLDRSRSGLVISDQTPMVELYERLNQSP
jgi:hypothetical protein